MEERTCIAKSCHVGSSRCPSHPAKVDLRDNEIALALCGNQNENLKLMERRLGVRVGQRGTELQPVRPRRRGGLRGPAAGAARGDDPRRARRSTGRTWSRRSRCSAAAGPSRSKTSAGRRCSRARGKRQIAPKSIAQKRYVDAIRAHDIVFGIGPAGTGKTYLAMAMAVAFLQERKVKRIVLARPAVEAGEKLGFLPGDLAEKVNPYLRPLYDALHDMMDATSAPRSSMEQGVIEVAPLAFMRGRTLNDAFVILDEAQNTTVEQMKMFLTRLGYNSKAVITGDVTQVDLPAGKASGLTHARPILKDIEGIAFSEFTRGGRGAPPAGAGGHPGLRQVRDGQGRGGQGAGGSRGAGSRGARDARSGRRADRHVISRGWHFPRPPSKHPGACKGPRSLIPRLRLA